MAMAAVLGDLDDAGTLRASAPSGPTHRAAQDYRLNPRWPAKAGGLGHGGQGDKPGRKPAPAGSPGPGSSGLTLRAL